MRSREEHRTAPHDRSCFLFTVVGDLRRPCRRERADIRRGDRRGHIAVVAVAVPRQQPARRVLFRGQQGLGSRFSVGTRRGDRARDRAGACERLRTPGGRRRPGRMRGGARPKHLHRENRRDRCGEEAEDARSTCHGASGCRVRIARGRCNLPAQRDPPDATPRLRFRRAPPSYHSGIALPIGAAFSAPC